MGTLRDRLSSSLFDYTGISTRPRWHALCVYVQSKLFQPRFRPRDVPSVLSFSKAVRVTALRNLPPDVNCPLEERKRAE